MSKSMYVPTTRHRPTRTAFAPHFPCVFAVVFPFNGSLAFDKHRLYRRTPQYLIYSKVCADVLHHKTYLHIRSVAAPYARNHGKFIGRH